MILYSNDCPKCKVLKMKLDQKNAQYEVCSELDELIARGIMSMPVLRINDEFLEFSEAVKYVNGL